MEVKIYGTLKALAIINDRCNSMMRNFLKEGKFIRKPNRDLFNNSWAKKFARHPAPKLNHNASTLAPQPMPAWHLKVPARHLDKPLILRGDKLITLRDLVNPIFMIESLYNRTC